jgi:hypothetical protein
MRVQKKCISTPDQEIERPYSRQKTFNKKEFMWKDKFSFYFSKSFYSDQMYSLTLKVHDPKS